MNDDDDDDHDDEHDDDDDHDHDDDGGATTAAAAGDDDDDAYVVFLEEIRQGCLMTEQFRAIYPIRLNPTLRRRHNVQGSGGWAGGRRLQSMCFPGLCHFEATLRHEHV